MRYQRVDNNTNTRASETRNTINKLSLYNNLITLGRVPEEYGRMNSLARIESILLNKNRNQKHSDFFVPQKATFTVNLPILRYIYNVA